MKNIYITWHYTTHGVAYLKHILSQFYINKKIQQESKISFDKLNQVVLNKTFDNPTKEGFCFDEIVYITASQKAFDNLSSRRFSYKNTILEDELIIENNLKDVFEKLISNEDIYYNIDKEIDFIRENYPEKYDAFTQVIWRNIQHYPIVEQIKWLKEFSNFKNVYVDNFKVVELQIDDLRDEKLIADKVGDWSRKYFSNNKEVMPVINVSLGSNETQVVWHILAEARQLPINTKFIKTYDDKSDNAKERFKKFSIKEIQTNLISSIGSEFNIYSSTKSTFRSLVNKKMKHFLNSGFSILLIGERGVGKSRIAESATKVFVDKRAFISANCASFDEDSKAESELFGYEKGAFTGAINTKKGLIEEANGGILFLDEIHHLSKLVQAKLMKALQTDANNKMAIRRLGSNSETKVECRLIFATNKNIEELKTFLLPDFYDRIVQHVILIPSLRETSEDRKKDWEMVWKQLKLEGEAPIELELVNWLKTLPLYGNFRDLEKIAIYYNVYNQFDEETKDMIQEATPFQYAKNEFKLYHSPVVQLEKEKYNFELSQNTKEMIAGYLFELQDWAVKKFGGRKKAIAHFRSLRDTITEKTLNDWKNKKSIKS